MKQSDLDMLVGMAARARQNSYSPISGFKVGAAIRTEKGNFYAGTNVEEAAFTSVIHAEQACIAQMVTNEGYSSITHVVVVGGKDDEHGMICAPCGHCRQLLGEFATDETEIISVGPQGDILLQTTFGALMPHRFGLNQFLDKQD